MSRQKFYIGWEDQMPPANKKALKKLLVPIVIALPVICLLLIYFTSPFNSHQFELGQVKEFTGTLHANPFPVLELDDGLSPIPGQRSALLVGYGKWGAKTYLPSDLGVQGKRVTLRGTLIYGDGKVLIEMTEKEQSVVDISDAPAPTNHASGNRRSTLLEGEILDPKCWFGVMKPAEGKVHKSCAIRCISGGIEPVLRVTNVSGDKYYIIKGVDGSDLNQQVLEFVAEPIRIEATIERKNGWNIAYVNTEEITYQ